MHVNYVGFEIPDKCATQKGYLFCSKSLLMMSLANLPLSSSKDCQNGCPFQNFFIIVKLQKYPLQFNQ